MNYIYISLVALFYFTSCNSKKYMMANMLGGDEYIDVSNYVKKGYKPVKSLYSDEICALVDTNKHFLTEIDFKEFERVIIEQIDSSGDKKISVDLKKSSYRHSYIIIKDLVDIYKLEYYENNIKKYVYFRVFNHKLILPISNEDWIQFSPTDNDVQSTDR